MTRAEVLEQWAGLANGQAVDAKLRAVGTWVARLLEAHPEELCEIWLGQLHIAASSNPAVAVLPDLMNALMQATCVDYGYDTRSRERRFVDAARQLAAKRESMGQREYILQLQELQREAGVAVYDGYTRRPVWARAVVDGNETFRQVGEDLLPVHPGNLVGVDDLLPESWRQAAAETRRREAEQEAVAVEAAGFPEIAPVSGYGELLEGVA